MKPVAPPNAPPPPPPVRNSKSEPPRELRMTAPVGFDNCPQQWVSHIMSDAFALNILVVGETGLGKSTLIDTLFSTRLMGTGEPGSGTHDHNEVTLKTMTQELVEGGVRLRLSVTETVGYGDQLNKMDSVRPIVEFVDAQFDAFLEEELRLKRTPMHTSPAADPRIHFCFYLIVPTGHSLKALDLVAIKTLASKINLIPVIAKADSLTRQELQKFKQRICQEFRENDVPIYQFPTDDPEMADQNSFANSLLPLAVIGSREEVRQSAGKMMRGRQYPWGTAQVECDAHCDFVKLRDAVIRTNMYAMIESTNSEHYEAYRRSRLSELGFSDEDGKGIRETYAQRLADHTAELQRREHEVRQGFVARVKETEASLKQAENELAARLDALKVIYSLSVKL